MLNNLMDLKDNKILSDFTPSLTKNVIGKVSHGPGRLFSISKSSSAVNLGTAKSSNQVNQALEPQKKLEHLARKGQKKTTILNLVQEKSTKILEHHAKRNSGWSVNGKCSSASQICQKT